MNLYLISQDENNNYDTYDSAIVCAPNEAVARTIHPGYNSTDIKYFHQEYSCWCSSPALVTVELVGIAHPNIPQGVVLASFNAG